MFSPTLQVTVVHSCCTRTFSYLFNQVISRPRDVNAVAGPMDTGGMYVFISWKLVATYYNPYPNKTYYATIVHEPGGDVAAALEVVGRVSHFCSCHSTITSSKNA